MKKLVLCLLLCSILILSCYSYADTGKYNFTVDDFKCFTYFDDKIFGSFEIVNNSKIHYEELKYMLYLLPQDIKDTGIISSAVSSGKTNYFSLYSSETKLIAFEFDVPYNIPYGMYKLALVVTDGVAEIGPAQFIENFELGQGNDGYIVNGDLENPNYYKIKGYEYPLSGPYMDPGKAPKAYLKIKSTFKENKTLIPEYQIYKRDLNFGVYVSTEVGDKITIKANSEKEIELQLPVVDEPDSYLIKVRLLDENNMPVSYEYYFRYVVNGSSAKISSINTLYDEYNETLKVFINFVGSADSENIENFEMKMGVYETEGNKMVDRYIDSGVLSPTEYMSSFTIKVPSYNPLLTAHATIKDGDKVLAKKIVKLSKEATSENLVEKFYDIRGTEYEKPVKMLNSYGIISGYPNGTYKPANTLTRAELTSIALNMKNVNLDEYEVKSNAFTDVDESHWAYKSINYAYENGIINGYGNGLFKPNNKVKYSEAITILLNVVGYKGKADSSRDTWPNNYISLAKELNITDDRYLTFDFTHPANRGDVAILTLNSYILRRD